MKHFAFFKLRTFLIIAVAALSILQVNAQIYVIDQQNNPQPITQEDLISALNPGQTFTPALGGIGFADFVLNNYSGIVGSVDVQLLNGMGGAVLGASGVVNVPGNNTFSYYRFLFPSDIAITPGQTYALQLAQIGGGSVWACEDLQNNYSGGVAYWPGGGMPPTWNYDYNFDEGIVEVPEPDARALVLLGLVGGLGARRGRRVFQAAFICGSESPVAKRQNRGRADAGYVGKHSATSVRLRR